MKKFATGLLVVAGALGLAACSPEEGVTNNAADTIATDDAAPGNDVFADNATAVDPSLGDANATALPPADEGANAAGNVAAAPGNAS